MYTILISKSDDEIERTLKELCSNMKQVRLSEEETASSQGSKAQFCRISTAKGIYNIPYSEILFVESGQKKSVIHLVNTTISLSLPLYRIRNVLPESYFIQTHRSFIINLQNVSYIDKTKDPWVIFFFKSSKTAFISRSFKKNFIQAITPFLDCIAD
ncbi:LytTR family transcriptional regulator DNA-binding domain-containing protein [Anaerotignum sp.]